MGVFRVLNPLHDLILINLFIYDQGHLRGKNNFRKIKKLIKAPNIYFIR